MKKNRKGIILAGGTGSRLFPITRVVSKQLLPVYDKPMIYYPLSVLMLAGIREILIITTPHDAEDFATLLGDGSQWGLEISYIVQERPEGLAQAFILAEEFLAGEPSCLILGDNLFYGKQVMDALEEAMSHDDGGYVFGYHTNEPEQYGVVEFDTNGKVLSIEEKPDKPKSRYAVPGLYFFDERAPAFAKSLKPSPRGELEIADLITCYLKEESLKVALFGRGTAWLDTGTPDGMAHATQFVQVIQQRQGLKIACPEEIAFEAGWISRVELEASADNYAKTEYGKYLLAILAEADAKV